MSKRTTKSPQGPVNLMLDSGAFSAWNQKDKEGKPKSVNIDIDEYTDFALRFENKIDYIVNLDVIPGVPGQKNLPPEEIERSASQGFDNYDYMISKGVPKKKLIHVFHQGEDFKWLEKMVEEMDYIGLSPANDRTTKEKMLWLDRCMPYVTDSDGMPLVKWHGFAVTSLRIMLRYPWYSVDSTSWVLTGRYGSIFVPKKKGGKYVYDQDSWKVCISNRSPNVEYDGKHFSTFSKMEQREIEAYYGSFGYKLGRSEIRKEGPDYKLDKAAGERWLGKADADAQRNIYGGTKNGFPKDGYVDKGFKLTGLVEVPVEPGLCNDYKQRDELNIRYFLDLEKNLPPWPQPYKKGISRTRFGKERTIKKTDRKSVFKRIPEGIKILFATWAEDNQGVTLTKIGGSNRLMSYYFLNTLPDSYLRRYLRYGEIVERK